MDRNEAARTAQPPLFGISRPHNIAQRLLNGVVRQYHAEGSRAAAQRPDASLHRLQAAPTEYPAEGGEKTRRKLKHVHARWTTLS